MLNVCKKVYQHQNIVETVIYGPKKSNCKNEVFLDFCLLVLLPISFDLIIMETPTKFLSPPMGLYFFLEKISVFIKLGDGTLIHVLLQKARCVTKLADGVVISSQAQMNYFWGHGCCGGNKT